VLQNCLIRFSEDRIWRFALSRVNGSRETPAAKIARDRAIAHSLGLKRRYQISMNLDGTYPLKAETQHSKLLIQSTDGR
jgi:hypothetical protein